ncbi:hypothetical protein [Mycobacterium tuberculosis]|uniref:hypothetical protein n=1 Tax=Mycobacterium tuberculosis TaxID=1773 RepID=UPI0009127A31|nr:hypothetical protein [Mycobacterium tuberculosis]SGI75154.1 Uncharacterised protein [Mycobacterium tuberculosis]
MIGNKTILTKYPSGAVIEERITAEAAEAKKLAIEKADQFRGIALVYVKITDPISNKLLGYWNQDDSDSLLEDVGKAW